MTSSIRILAPSSLAILLASCAAQKSGQYDTPAATAYTDGSVNAPAQEPANPVYDTPAAYEESASTTPASANPNIPITPPSAAPSAAVAKPSANGAAIIHTVVAGDTLSGISAKYKIPAASIKKANGMTKDTVVLGRKMAIPPQ